MNKAVHVTTESVRQVARETLSPEVARLAEPQTCVKCGGEVKYDGRRWKCAACVSAYQRAWRKAHPLNAEQRHKDSVRSIAGVNKRRGKLQPKPCEVCGSADVQMHHEDYARPLDVRWLCKPCHTAEHHPDSYETLVEPGSRRQRRGAVKCAKCDQMRAPGSGYCKEHRAAAQREFRKRRKEELAALRKMVGTWVEPA